LIFENDISAFEGRHNVIKELLPIFKRLTASSKDYYVRELSDKLSIKEQSLYDEIENFALPDDHPARDKEIEINSENKLFSLEQIVFGIVLENPSLFNKLTNLVDCNDFEGEEKDVYNELLAQYNEARNGFKNWNLDKGFLADVKEKINILNLYVEEKYSRLSEDSLRNEIEKLVDKIKETRRSKQLNELQLNISKAERAGEKEK